MPTTPDPPDGEVRAGAAQARICDCNASYGSCTTIVTATTTATPWSPTGTWTPHIVNFGAINHALATGRTLVIKLVVDPVAGDYLWIAYDTTNLPANLTITP